MKKTQNMTFVPPSTAVEGAEIEKDTTQKSTKAPAGTAPRKKAPSKRSAKVKNTKAETTVTTLPDEDYLQEVLEDGPIYDESPVEEPEEIPTEKNLTPAEQRQRRRQRRREEELSALELIRKKSGLSENDVAMIFELGYENELGRLVGYENLKRLKNDHLKRRAVKSQGQYRTAFGFRGEEYTGEQNQDSIAAAYLQDRRQLWLRVALSAVLTLLLVFVDMPHLVADYLPAFVTAQSFFLPLVGIVLLAGVAFLSRNQVIAGLQSLFGFQPTPYSLPAIILPVTLIYDLIGFWMPADILRVNFLTALLFMLTVVCDLLRFSCERRTLALLAKEDEMTVLVPATPRKKKLRHGDKIVKIINDDIGETRYQVRQSMQTVGFFRRFNDMSSAARPFCIFLATAFSLSTLVAFACALYTHQFSLAVSAFMTALFLSIPACAVFAFFYPLVRANRLLAGRGCALIGTEAIDEYDCGKTIIFADTDLYNAEKCTEISVRESDDFKEDMRLAGALFRKLGGTLAHVGEAFPSLKKDPPVAVTRILESGVEAVVDNRYHVLAGDGEFMLRNGVKIPRESTDKVLRRSSDVSLLYVAIDGTLKLSYEIEYGTRRPFEKIIRHLTEANCAVAISSYDPNLDEVFVQKSRDASREPIGVIKPNRWEEARPLEIADAGAVATKKPHDIVYPLYAANAIGKTRRFAFRMQLIASILGAASVGLLTFLGQLPLLGIVPILCYQLCWIAVFAVASMSEINPEQMHFPKK